MSALFNTITENELVSQVLGRCGITRRKVFQYVSLFCVLIVIYSICFSMFLKVRQRVSYPRTTRRALCPDWESLPCRGIAFRYIGLLRQDLALERCRSSLCRCMDCCV